MARYAGNNLWVRYKGSVLSTIRSIEWEDTADDIEATAAGDTRKQFVAGLIEGNFSVEALDDDVSNTIFNVLEPQNTGELVWGPAGSVSGKKRFTASTAVVISRNQAVPYDDIALLNSELRLSVVPTADTF